MIGRKNKKEEKPLPRRQNTDEPVSRTPPRPVAKPASRESTRIGKSVRFQGELSGNEDLTIDGTVEGKVVLKSHNLTIGANGHVTAEIWAKCVVVIGHVVGNIRAESRIEVADGGTVEGDLAAPRVVLTEGSRFKGSVDMITEGQPKSAAPALPSASAPAGAPAPASRVHPQ